MGKLYVIEGLDGSGKATQASRLFNYLNDKGILSKQLSFPAYDSDSSALIKMYLTGEFGLNPEDVNCYGTSLFYAVDRFAQWKLGIEEAYNSDTVLVSDRYMGSNMIHQGSKIADDAKRREFYDWCMDLEFNKLGLPKPDKTFLLLVEPEVSQELLNKRYHDDTSKKDIHEGNLDYLRKCYKSALDVANYCNWGIINCTEQGAMRTIDDISNEIISKIGL